MSEKIKNILIGLILGDGHLTTPYGESGRSSLDMKVDDKSFPYLRWIHRELKSLGVSTLRPKKNYHQHRFYTKRTREIGELRELFYPKGEKIVPLNIKEIFTSPLSLAVWYQDDGTLDSRNKYHHNSLFATHCFSLNDCRLLAEMLRDNFGLDVRVCRSLMRGKIRYRLYVTSKSMELFIQLVRPYINKCFAYKIRKRQE